MTAFKTIDAEEFDCKVDNGEDISEFLDWSTAFQPNLDHARKMSIALA